MRIPRWTVIALGISLLPPAAPGEVIQKNIVSFAELDGIVLSQQQKYGVDEVLLVFDLDNTLLTSDTDLGSDIWYRWVTEGVDGLKADGQKGEVPACLYDVVGLLYEMGTMKPVEEIIPGLVASWQEKGYPMLVLTSRGVDYRAATERELRRNNIDISRSALTCVGCPALEFSYMALSKGKSRSDPQYKKADLRKVSYKNGVFMTSGANKGSLLDQMLERTGRRFQAVIFVDDTEKNIKAVEGVFSERDDVEVVAAYYTRVEEERKRAYGAILTIEQADKMANDFRQLMTVLGAIFPQRKAAACGY